MMATKSRHLNNKGSAILFAVFMMMLLLFIAMEISKDTIVEYQSSMNSVRRVQAYYAAKACNELALLRVKAYQQATRALGKSLPDPSMLDLIWSFPLAWPLPVPPDMNEGDKSAVTDILKLSTFKHQFSSKIASETGKIDINDLASPSEGIRNKTRQQILDLFESKLREQNDWSKKYYNYRFEDLVSHITDWIDADRTALLGGDESSYYRDLPSSLYIPPNQPFKTMEELHMVKGMEDEIYDVLAPAITLYGGKGINVNYADKDLLMAIDAQITEEVAAEILKRREDVALGGPFKDEKDFFGFIGGWGVNTDNFNEDKIPLYYDSEINFYISCIGVAGSVSREIRSVVYDFQKVQSRLKKSLSDATLDKDDPCFGKQGDEKYECVCRDKTDAAQKKKCIDDEKKKDQQASKDQGTEPALPPGPPYVIFSDVK